MRKHSLKSQILFSILFAVFLTVAFFSILANMVIQKQFKEYILRQQKLKEQEIVNNVSGLYDSGTKQWNMESVHAIGMYSLYEGYIISVKDMDKNTIWDAKTHDMALCQQIMDTIEKRMNKEKPGLNGNFQNKTYQLLQKNVPIGHVTIQYYGPYFYTSNDFDFLKALNILLVVVAVFSILISIIIALLLANRLNRPMKQMTLLAKDMAEGNYSYRLKISNNTKEIDELSKVMNTLACSLQEQEKIRTQLTADVAHELRTPLTAVGTHLEAMIEGIWEPTNARLSSCYEEIEYLSKLVEDLEGLAKADSDNLNLKYETFDINEIINLWVNLMESEIHKKQLNVTYSKEKVTIVADKDRINQVICNLLSNAIKYSNENGKIWIETKEMQKETIFKISDTGIGIAKEDINYIFERFYRADKSRNRNNGGAGIGLCIVKSIVQAHNGNIKVTSALGKGSSFTLAFPKEQPIA